MRERLESFVALSAALTGFTEVRLWGSGVAGEHLAVLTEVVPADVVADLLDGTDGPDATAMLGDARLGPVARNLIVLWYSGVWMQLPATWRDAYGASSRDTTHTTSGAAYRAGLQWVVAGAHPPGASHQGFGAWSLEPKRRQA